MDTAKIDLHLHLDGSLNIMWAYKKALQRNVIDKDMSFEDFYNLKSATTRLMREGETDGREYYFRDEDYFKTETKCY